jgi:serine/threonine protein kinase
VAVQVGRALAGLDAVDLLHLGVAPTSVVITPDGRAVLTELGLGLEVEVRQRISAGTVMVEAVDYMSPELIEGEHEPTSKCDVYGLGATLFRCLTGRSPYGGTTLFTRLRAIWSDEPPDLRRLQPDVPDALARLIWRLMERDADDRPLAQDVSASAERVAQQLGAGEAGWEKRILAELVAEAGEASRAAQATDVAELPLNYDSDQRIQIRLRGKDKSFSHTLAGGESLDIGRSSTADVSIRIKSVSRQHAKISRTPEGFVLTDLGSANGSVHNGTRVKGSVLLRSGDVIGFGKSSFEVTFSLPEQVSERTTATVSHCRLCGDDLDTAVRSKGSAVCARCLDRAVQDQSAGDDRVCDALADVGFKVEERLPAGGLLKRFRASSSAGGWLLSAAELGPPAAKAFAAASQPARSMEHPYLLPAREVLVNGGTLIVAYSPQPGRTLAEMVEDRGPIDVLAALHVGSCLADALAYAEAAGVHYVLVRPDLVLLDEQGSPLLLHVGLAPGLVEAQRSRVGLTTVEPCYEAPELARGSRMDARSVVYALGATLCYALTGNPVAELRGGERHEQLRLTMVESLPRPVASLLARATSPDPRDRPASLRAFGAALLELTEEDSSAEEGTDPGLASQEETQQINLDDLPPELRG